MGAPKQNWFPSLYDALMSEDLLHTWDCFFRGISYGETFSYTYDDGTKYGHFVSIYRETNGLYERPIHYKR